MPGKAVTSPNSTVRPFQFSLRQMALAVLAVSIACALVVQLGAEGVVFSLMLASMAAMCYGAYWANAWFVVGLVGLLFGGWIMAGPRCGPRSAFMRSDCCDKLKMIGIALHNYHDDFGCFPPAYVAGANGRPMHSWRVLILPYLEEKPLYDRYDFSEPWDGPNNSKRAAEMPTIYRCASEDRPPGSTDTSYVAVVGPGTIWKGVKGVSMAEIKDGTSNTLLIVESHGSGINWMEPRDLHTLQMAAGINPLKGQGICSCHNYYDKGRGDCAQVLIADGSVKRLENNVPPKTIDAMLTIAGGESVTVP